MGDKDEDSICNKCGTTAENHFVRWDDGVPVVMSYRDAPNGRICSPVAVESAPAPVDPQPCELEWFEARGQAFCNTHRRYEIDCVRGKLRRAVEALNKIHDLVGQMSGPNPHPHLGAIQDWCHQVTGTCEEKKAGGALK